MWGEKARYPWWGNRNLLFNGKYWIKKRLKNKEFYIRNSSSSFLWRNYRVCNQQEINKSPQTIIKKHTHTLQTLTEWLYDKQIYSRSCGIITTHSIYAIPYIKYTYRIGMYETIKNENTVRQKKWRISSGSPCVFLYFLNFRLMKTKRK